MLYTIGVLQLSLTPRFVSFNDAKLAVYFLTTKNKKWKQKVFETNYFHLKIRLFAIATIGLQILIHLYIVSCSNQGEYIASIASPAA